MGYPIFRTDIPGCRVGEVIIFEIGINELLNI